MRKIEIKSPGNFGRGEAQGTASFRLRKAILRDENEDGEGVRFVAKILLVSRCAWTLYNFRQGQMRVLKQRGDEVIGGGSAGDGFEPKIEALDVPFVALPIDRKALNPAADLRLILTLWRWYRREKPEIAHHFTIKPVIYGSLAARLARVPRIVNTVTGLGYVFTEGSPKWLRRLVEWQYKIALSGSHYTFFQNPDDRDLFLKRRLVRPERAGLLPGSGVDTARFQPETEDEARDANRPVRFLMVARVLRDKGVYEFAEAARLVKRELPGVEFLLLGQRDERNPAVVPLADLSQWQKEGLVCWLGEVDDVRAIVAEADAVVLPSYREGTPRALLEAAALGKPLITTDTVGCREAVEDGKTGLLVPVKNAPALAEAMLKLACDPELRRRMGQAGRAKMVRDFDETIVLNKIVAVYDRERL